MKTTITIEDGKITVEVDDQIVSVQPSAAPVVAHDKPLEPPAAVKPVEMPAYVVPPVKSLISRPSSTEKDCYVCGQPFTPKTRLSRFCSQKCERAFHNKNSRLKRAGRAPLNPDRDPWPGLKSRTAKKLEAQYCSHCRAFTTHNSGNHPVSGVVAPAPKPLNPEPEFMPGYEKSPEELASWQPKMTGGSEPIPQRKDPHHEDRIEVEKVMDEQRANFDNPWDCSVCQNAGALCDLHEKMQADGKSPPKFKNVGSASNRGGYLPGRKL
jgi:hypothetical protein